MRARHKITGLLAVVAACAALPGAAEAATVHGSFTNGVEFRAGSGEVNSPSLFLEAGELTIADRVQLQATGGCRVVALSRVRCGTPARAGSVSLRLGDRDDTATVSIPELRTFVFGEGGEDVIKNAVKGRSNVEYDGGTSDFDDDKVSYLGQSGGGVLVTLDNGRNDGVAARGDTDNVETNIEDVEGSIFNDTITGDDDNNAITGGPGNDILLGGGSFDTFHEGSAASGADFIDGGPNQSFTTDDVDYGGRRNGISVTLGAEANDGEPGEGDNVQASVETVIGGVGFDALVGTDLPNTLIGNAGDDAIRGRGGKDSLFGGLGADGVSGGAGDDTIVINDGDRDQLTNCGPDRDRVLVDLGGIDSVSECETLEDLPPREVGEAALSPRTVTVRPGRRAELRLTWSHPLDWKMLDQVILRLRHGGRTVGRIAFDQEARVMRAGGGELRPLAHRGAVTGGVDGGKGVIMRVSVRIPQRYAAQRLTAQASSTDDSGHRQGFQAAGSIRVSAR